jgi:zinc transport system substrate-binding protein
MKRASLFVRVVGVMVLVLFATAARTFGDKPTAVTAIFSYYDALRAIGGDDVHSVILLPPGASPHDYEPTVKDRVTASNAQLIIANGLNIDKWITKIAADTPSAITINVSELVMKKGIQPLHTEEVSVTEAKDQKPDAEDDSAGNPHIWLDPRVQAMAAEAIRDALEKIDPAHTEHYKQRAGVYLAQLAALDKDFSAATAQFKRKDFIGFHSAYAYLARRYGLHQVASVEELPGEGPTISQTANIIRLIKAKDIHVIFTENAFPAKAADMIVRETGVTTGVLQPLETYDDVKQTYVGLMRENLEAFKKALQ